MVSFRLRISNIRQLVQVCENRELRKYGTAQDQVAILSDAAIVVDNEGRIQRVGSMPDVEEWLQGLDGPVEFEQDIDGRNLVIVPGLIDGHTHPVWSGNRVGEFSMKLAGATYMEIHESGGGIHSTVRSTRCSTEDELRSLFLNRLDRMLRFGTTMIEAKSGYGLDTETEIKMLRVLHAPNHPIEVVANFLGAHSIPEGSDANRATRDVIDHQIPAVIEAKNAGVISPELIDVFCEKGVFEREDTRKILQAGVKAGLLPNFHGDEIHPMQSGQLGAEIGAISISHLEAVDENGMNAMAAHSPPICAVLLPTTKYVLNLPSPPARKLIEKGVPVALGSDFNPNAHCLSMPMAMNMACVLLGMTMNESLVAATINAAASVGKSKDYGSLEDGKIADLVALNAPRWEHLIYEIGDPPIEFVVKKGKIVYRRTAN